MIDTEEEVEEEEHGTGNVEWIAAVGGMVVLVDAETDIVLLIGSAAGTEALVAGENDHDE